MTIEQAIYTLKLLTIMDDPGLKEAVDMAVSALLAQQSPAKLERSRWEGCETCKGGRYRRGEYCPGCGKPLTEEAWAELKKRAEDDEAD